MAVILIVDFEDGVDKIAGAIAKRYACETVDDISHPHIPLFIELRGKKAYYASDIRNLPYYLNYEASYFIDVVEKKFLFELEISYE